MTTHPSRAGASFTGAWIWLFPATYLVHVAEEYFGGFPSFAADFSGLPVSNTAFLAANAVFWLLMVGAVSWAARSASGAPLAVALATIVTVNAVLHAAATLLKGSYSPGLMSATFLWLPLGVLSLVRGKQTLASSALRTGIALGLGIHVLVPLIGLGFVLVLS